jgi:hypothetical protein
MAANLHRFKPLTKANAPSVSAAGQPLAEQNSASGG